MLGVGAEEEAPLSSAAALLPPTDGGGLSGGHPPAFPPDELGLWCPVWTMWSVSSFRLAKVSPHARQRRTLPTTSSEAGGEEGDFGGGDLEESVPPVGLCCEADGPEESEDFHVEICSWEMTFM